MKNTSVTPSATFDAMPSPNQSAKIGASTTRGSALSIFTYGSNTALIIGFCAEQKPISTPASETTTKTSTPPPAAQPHKKSDRPLHKGNQEFLRVLPRGNPAQGARRV